MPRVKQSRRISAAPEDVWRVVGDPHHLSRWWPRVERVEGVAEDAFTEVLRTNSGRALRADFRVLAVDPGRRIAWQQELEGTPFARVLRSSETEVALEELDGATEVTIELRQSVHGFFSRFGGFMVRRAGHKTLVEGLEGLARIV